MQNYWKKLCFVALILGAISHIPGCDGQVDPSEILNLNAAQSQTQTSDRTSGQLVSTRSNIVRSRGLPVRSRDTILVASFNIQVFGEKKLKDAWVIEHIVEIIRQFDVVAIQEVRAIDQSVIPTLVSYVNAQGARYDYLLGPRVGRTDSQEQYAFLYDTNTVVSSPNASYTIEDSLDYLHREPMVARFVTRVPPNVRPFSFSLVNIHTDPDEVKTELPVMHTVLKGIREFEYLSAQEDDVILMGDLNAAPNQFGPLAQVPGIFWTVQDTPTNTRRTKIYDNIIFDRGLTNEFTGRCGVLDMAELFGLKMEDALRISDHNPIWAEFAATELQPGVNLQAMNPNTAAQR